MPILNNIASVFFFLIFFGAILFLAFVSTKLLGSKASKGMRGRHLKVIDTITLGFDKQIHLVKVGEQLLLVSSSNKSIQFLSSLDSNLVKISEEDMKIIEEENTIKIENVFKNYLEVFKNTNKKSEDSKPIIGLDTETNRFDQNLSKLKRIFSKINSEKNGDEKPNE